MRFKPLHDTEGNALGEDPDTVENTDIERIRDVGEKRPEGYGIIVHRENDTVDSEVQCRSNSIFKISDILPADRDAYADKFFLGKFSDILQSLDCLPETSVHPRNMVMERGVRSPEFYVKKRTPCADNSVEIVRIRKCPSVCKEFDSSVSIFPGNLKNIEDIVPGSRFTTIERDAIGFSLACCGRYCRKIILW